MSVSPISFRPESEEQAKRLRALAGLLGHRDVSALLRQVAGELLSEHEEAIDAYLVSQEQAEALLAQARQEIRGAG